MDKKVLAAAAVVIVAAVVAVLIMTRPEKGVRTGTEPHPFPGLRVKPPEDPKARREWESPLKRNIDKLEITRQGKTIVLTRIARGKAKNDVGEWQMTSPVKYAAHSYHVRSLINRLERLEFWEVISRNPADYKELQVDNASGTRLRVFAGSQLLADMIVGKTVTAKMEQRSQTYTAVRAHGKKAVWKLGGSVSYIFNKPLERWRDDTILKEKRDDLAAVTVQGNDGTLLAVKRNPDEKDRTKKYNNWELVKSEPALDRLDQSEVGRIASTVSNLRASGFSDQADAAKAGLDKPLRRITVVYKKPAKPEEKARPGAKPARPGDEKKPRPGAEQPKARAGKTARARPGGRSAPTGARNGPKTREKASSRVSRPAGDKPAPAKTAEPAAGAAGTDPSTGVPEVDALIRNKQDYVTFVILVGNEDKKEKSHYVQMLGKDQIFLVRTSTVSNFLKKVVDFKDKTVLALKPDEVTGIEVDKEGKKTVLKKEGKAWKAVVPKDLKLDGPGVDRVVKMLENRFKARQFADTDDPKKTGLGKPKGTVKVLLKGKRPVELLVGNEFKKAQWYLQVKGRKDVYVMSSYPLNQIYTAPDKWKKAARPPGRRRRGGPGTPPIRFGR